MSNSVSCSHPSCNRSFKSQDSMQQHHRDTHSQPHQLRAKLPCVHDQCAKSFPTKQGLEDHLRFAHHLNPQDAAAAAADAVEDLEQIMLASDQVLEDQQVGDVACNDCGDTFRTMDALHQHQWASPGHTRVSKTRNPNGGSSMRMCSQCDDKFPRADHLEQHYIDRHPISEVEKSGEERIWQQVEERFSSKWTNSKIKPPKVHQIFKVYNPGWRRKDFEEYRKELKKQMSNEKIVQEDDLDLRNKVLSHGNEVQRYHGTTVKCQLGRPPKNPGKGMDAESTALSLCPSMDCSMCRILQTGFKKSKCKVKKFQRFGEGIYCSSVSSKASAYVNCSASAASSNKNGFLGYFNIGCVGRGNYKVMMACKVLAGRPYHSTSNMRHLKGPPDGFHSVQGDPGDVLNYEELVVYDDRAILPDFIILYSSSD